MPNRITTATYCFTALFLLLASTIASADEAPQTGIYTTSFEQRSSLSTPRAIAKATRWPLGLGKDYDIADHAFQLVVPEEYDDSEAYGLFVFIHSKDDITTEGWFYGRVLQEVLAKHKLIWVSYNKAGNPAKPGTRLGLALDAVKNVKSLYKIDDRRVYLSGVSGGGRMTCVSAVAHPEIFTGAIPIIGTNYFRKATLPKDPALRALIQPEIPKGATIWPRGVAQPSTAKLRKMKAEQRWVLLAGETDYNMPEMRAHYEQGFKKDRFEYAHYLEVPGMGHEYPPADWIEKAIVLLDAPLKPTEPTQEPAKEPAKDPANLPADERTQRLAQRRLEVALRSLDRDHDRGILALTRLVEDLPNTEAAKQAKEKLDSLEQ